MRVYLFFTFLNRMRICVSTYLPAIGKAAKGAAIAFVFAMALLWDDLHKMPRQDTQ